MSGRAGSRGWYRKDDVNAKFEIYQDTQDKWRWRLKGGNGEIVASGEPYDNESNVRRAVQALREQVGEALDT